MRVIKGVKVYDSAADYGITMEKRGIEPKRGEYYVVFVSWTEGPKWCVERCGGGGVGFMHRRCEAVEVALAMTALKARKK